VVQGGFAGEARSGEPSFAPLCGSAPLRWKPGRADPRARQSAGGWPGAGISLCRRTL